jgi:hypothetical protein
MGTVVMIYGQSGTGKSSSLRNFEPNQVGIINVSGKPMPFRKKLPYIATDDYTRIMNTLHAAKAPSIVIDDAGYLITNHFMRGHSSVGRGNEIFSFYNTIADNFWNLISFITEKVQPDKIVYIMMHEDKDDSGEVKAKTIGKLLDEKVCVEGMFTIVLRCVSEGEGHDFITQTANGAISKSPMGMFEDLTIDNDLAQVDAIIRDYYGMEDKNKANAEDNNESKEEE